MNGAVFGEMAIGIASDADIELLQSPSSSRVQLGRKSSQLLLSGWLATVKSLKTKRGLLLAAEWMSCNQIEP